MDVGDGGQPFVGQQGHKGRVVHRRLALAQVRPIGAVGHAAAAAVGLQQGRQRVHRTHNQLGHWGKVVQTVALDQDLHVPGRHQEPALAVVQALVFGRQNPRHGLLFEPFAHVALVGARVRRQFRRGERAILGQRAVKAQAVADVDRENVKRARGILQKLFDEQISLLRNRI